MQIRVVGIEPKKTAVTTLRAAPMLRFLYKNFEFKASASFQQMLLKTKKEEQARLQAEAARTCANRMAEIREEIAALEAIIHDTSKTQAERLAAVRQADFLAEELHRLELEARRAEKKNAWSKSQQEKVRT